jgi:membrane-bound lytic murein transglycosylase F
LTRRRGVLAVRVASGVALLAAVVLVAPAAQAQSKARRHASALLASLDTAARERHASRQSRRFDAIFQKYAKRYFGVGTDWRWFKAQGMAESDLTPTARSRVGARGIMQLMPSTYGQIKSALPQFGRIDDPQWNIAAGILHDHDLWVLWNRDVPEDQRWAFMFASYNAGEGTIMRARRTAAAEKLDQSRWPAIERVAPKVERWRYSETLGYVRTITANKDSLGVTP